MPHSPLYPHDPIEEIAPDAYMVRGTIRMNPLVRITRNMAILRHGDDVTVIDPIRLDPAGEAALKELGIVRRILRLGPMHGVDDAYYRDTFRAELWAPGPSTTHPEPKVDVVVGENADLGIPDTRLFCFQGLKQPEAALLVERGKGLLLTCDAIQHYGDYRHNNWFARRLLPWIGFPRTTVVGPLWLKVMTPEGGHLESEFRRLAELDFDALLSAHGSFLASGAKASVQAAIDRAFPATS